MGRTDLLLFLLIQVFIGAPITSQEELDLGGTFQTDDISDGMIGGSEEGSPFGGEIGFGSSSARPTPGGSSDKNDRVSYGEGSLSGKDNGTSPGVFFENMSGEIDVNLPGGSFSGGQNDGRPSGGPSGGFRAGPDGVSPPPFSGEGGPPPLFLEGGPLIQIRGSPHGQFQQGGYAEEYRESMAIEEGPEYVEPVNKPGGFTQFVTGVSHTGNGVFDAAEDGVGNIFDGGNRNNLVVGGSEGVVSLNRTKPDGKFGILGRAVSTAATNSADVERAKGNGVLLGAFAAAQVLDRATGGTQRVRKRNVITTRESQIMPVNNGDEFVQGQPGEMVRLGLKK